MLEYVQRCDRLMPEPLAAHYFRQLVDAVAYMHAQVKLHMMPRNTELEHERMTLGSDNKYKVPWEDGWAMS